MNRTKLRMPQPWTARKAICEFIVPYRTRNVHIEFDRATNCPTGRIYSVTPDGTMTGDVDNEGTPGLVAVQYQGVEVHVELRDLDPTGNFWVYASNGACLMAVDSNERARYDFQMMLRVAKGEQSLEPYVIHRPVSRYKLRGLAYYDPNVVQFRAWREVPRELTESQRREILEMETTK
jgi:hypothetical protein